MDNKNYCIVGDFKLANGKIQSCLITPLHGADENRAKEVAQKCIENPPADCLGNIHYTTVPDSKAWWYN